MKVTSTFNICDTTNFYTIIRDASVRNATKSGHFAYKFRAKRGVNKVHIPINIFDVIENIEFTYKYEDYVLSEDLPDIPKYLIGYINSFILNDSITFSSYIGDKILDKYSIITRGKCTFFIDETIPLCKFRCSDVGFIINNNTDRDIDINMSMIYTLYSDHDKKLFLEKEHPLDKKDPRNDFF